MAEGSTVPDGALHGPRFWDYLFELQQASSLCDVQLCVKNENDEVLIYPAHKLVLAASSSYFHKCLVSDTFLDVYNFDGITSEQLELVVDYMYRQVSWKQLIGDEEASRLVSTLGIYNHEWQRWAAMGRVVTQEATTSQYCRPVVKGPRKSCSERIFVSSETAKSLVEKTKEERRLLRTTRSTLEGATEQTTDVLVSSGEVDSRVCPNDGSPLKNIIAVDNAQTSSLADPPAVVSSAMAGSPSRRSQRLGAKRGGVPDYSTMHEGVEFPQECVPEARSKKRRLGEDDEEIQNAEYYVGLHPSTSSQNTNLMSEVHHSVSTQSTEIPVDPCSATTAQNTEYSVDVRPSTSAQNTEYSVDVRPSTSVQNTEYSVDVRPSTSAQNAEGIVETSFPTLAPEGQNEGKVDACIEASTSGLPTPRQCPAVSVETDASGVAVSPRGVPVKTEESESRIKKEMTLAKEEEENNTEDKTSGDEAHDRKLYVAIGDGLFSCSICKKQIKGEDAIKSHTPRCKVPLGNKCQLCKFSCFTKDGLLRHIEKAHGIPTGVNERNKNLFHCDYCVEAFTSKKELNEHMMSAHDEKPYKCALCEAAFRSAMGLQHHHTITHTDSKHVCEVCGKDFRAESQLKTHLKNTHKDVADLECKLCLKKFKLFNSLKRHLKTYHSDARPFECEVCSSAFKSKEDMKRHKQLHFTPSSRYSQTGEKYVRHPPGLDYPCSFCGKIFKNYFHKKAHENIQHKDKMAGVSYLCTLCNKSYQARHYLNMHINNVHKPKRFVCTGCHRTYQFNYELVRHVPRCRGYPEGPKPFACSQCGTQFTIKGNLTKHQQRGSCKPNKAVSGVEFVVVVQQEGETEKVEIPLNQLQDLGIEAEEVLLASESIADGMSERMSEAVSEEASDLQQSMFRRILHDSESEARPTADVTYATEQPLQAPEISEDHIVYDNTTSGNAGFEVSDVKIEKDQYSAVKLEGSSESVKPKGQGSRQVIVYDVSGNVQSKLLIDADSNIMNL